jgi:SagB-type dehydrogenase family enzyme
VTQPPEGPDPAQPLTLRLEPGRAVCSDDYGATWTRQGPFPTLVSAVTTARWSPAAPAEPTAASLGLLAESRNSRPAAEAPPRTPPNPGSRTPAATPVRIADTLPSSPLAQVLAARRSRRSLGGALPLQPVACLLARVLATSTFDPTAPGPRALARLPSAGGRRPVRVALLALRVNGLSDGSLWGFDPNASVLRRVDSSEAQDQRLVEAAVAAGSLHGPPAALLLLLADFARTTSRYPAGAALVWRDAGVVLGGLCLGAEDLGLASCPLGTSSCVPPVLAAAAYTATGATPYDTVHDLGMLALGSRSSAPRG